MLTLGMCHAAKGMVHQTRKQWEWTGSGSLWVYIKMGGRGVGHPISHMLPQPQ